MELICMKIWHYKVCNFTWFKNSWDNFILFLIVFYWHKNILEDKTYSNMVFYFSLSLQQELPP